MVRSTRRCGRTGRIGSRRCAAVDPRASVAGAVAMADIVAAESAPWRFVVRVFLAFATLAALLSAIGLGTVIALAVSTRRRELAIRAALGADRRRLRAVVMKEGTMLVGLGVLAGLACALALGRAVAAVLVGVQPHDPIALLHGRHDRLRRRAHRVLVAVAPGRVGRSRRGAAGGVTRHRHRITPSSTCLRAWRAESLRLVVEHQHPVEHLAGVRWRERALARVGERADGGRRAGARD